MKQHRKAFQHHGVMLELNAEKEWIAQCPFCKKDWHFIANDETGLWNCRRCGMKGNMYSFLSQWHDHCLGETETKHYKQLAKNRGLSVLTLLEASLAWDNANDCWLFPIYRNDKLVNLKTWRWVEGKSEFHATPCCATHPYIIEGNSTEAPTYICEAEWAVLALKESGVPFRFASGMPGANAFKQEWLSVFDALDEICLVYDNDKAGEDGIKNATKLLARAAMPPKKLTRLSWPKGTREKYDLRSQHRDHKNLTSFLPENIQEIDMSKSVKVVEHASWDGVLNDFRELYLVDQDFADAVTLVGATLISSKIPGDPLWMFLVGPPSTAKTVIVDAFSGDKDHCETLSKLTATSLISGWKIPGKDEDVSIFPLLKNRCLLILDYTTIMSLPTGTQEELYGMLREAFGGRVKVRYGNGKIVDYEDVSFSIVAAVTDKIREDNRADLGERFLKVEVIGAQYDGLAATLAALDNVIETDDRKFKRRSLSDAIKSYLNGLYINPNALPAISQDYRVKIANLAMVVAHLRAVVNKSEDGSDYEARPEGGGRLGKQLGKLGTSLCVLLKKPEVDGAVYRLIRKAALDTIRGRRLRIISALMQVENGMTTDDLATRLQKPKSTMVNHLHALQALGAVQRGSVSGGQGGRFCNVWFPTTIFKQMWLDAGLEQKKKKAKVK